MLKHLSVTCTAFSRIPSFSFSCVSEDFIEVDQDGDSIISSDEFSVIQCHKTNVINNDNHVLTDEQKRKIKLFGGKNSGLSIDI